MLLNKVSDWLLHVSMATQTIENSLSFWRPGCLLSNNDLRKLSYAEHDLANLVISSFVYRVKNTRQTCLVSRSMVCSIWGRSVVATDDQLPFPRSWIHEMFG